ncbi:MAG: replication protein [Dehalococcoidia bacterium]
MNELEAGYTKIPNDILEGLCFLRMPGEVRQIVDTVMRQTLGWNKDADRISLGQFKNKTGMHRSNVARAIKKAIDHNLIHKVETGNYALNLNTDEWVPFDYYRLPGRDEKGLLSMQTPVISQDSMVSAKIAPVINQDSIGAISQDNKMLSAKIHTKDIKETITKETHTKELEITLRGAGRPMPATSRVSGEMDTLDHNTPAPVSYEDCLALVTAAPDNRAAHAALATAAQRLHPALADKDFSSLCGLMGTYLQRLGGDREHLMKIIGKAGIERPGDPIAYIGGAIRSNKNTTLHNSKAARDPGRYTRGRYGHVVNRPQQSFRIVNKTTGEVWEGEDITAERACLRAGKWAIEDCEIEDGSGEHAGV